MLRLLACIDSEELNKDGLVLIHSHTTTAERSNAVMAAPHSSAHTSEQHSAPHSTELHSTTN